MARCKSTSFESPADLGVRVETNRVGDFDHETDRNVRAQQIYQTIDRQSFQWVVVFVAGIGFFLVSFSSLISQWCRLAENDESFGHDRNMAVTKC
jgi:hypothetical protein